MEVQNNNNFGHLSVLSKELITGLKIISSGSYLDATLGRGGHSELILAHETETRVIGLDLDRDAIAAVKIRLESYIPERLTLCHSNFAQYEPQGELFDGIVADLGVSSPQFDVAERGFSFRQEAPLDMRMDCTQSLTAADIINYEKEVSLADILYKYGEERFSRRIARNIVQKRPFNTTTELASAITKAVPGKYRYGKIHPATRTFQALRIAVNQELTSLETFIDKAPHWLKSEGIIGIISFHSLEDRIVKHGFRNHDLLEVITKKPIIPQMEEQKANPRSRSAKLRFARRKN